MQRNFWLLWLVVLAHTAFAGPYDPGAEEPGSLAVPKNDGRIVGWASGYSNLVRGPINIAQPAGAVASSGIGEYALGAADADDDALKVVSLGDGGSITLHFEQPIANGSGADFAVFENGFIDVTFEPGSSFLELAFVEVSSNGTRFVRFPAVSLTQTTSQIGNLQVIDPTNLDNLAGKYVAGYGTPFDLADLAAEAAPDFDLMSIMYVRIIDVVGKISGPGMQLDSQNHPINDPYTTAFATGGFDLDAVAVMNIPVPEPSAGLMSLTALGALTLRRRRSLQ